MILNVNSLKLPSKTPLLSRIALLATLRKATYWLVTQDLRRMPTASKAITHQDLAEVKLKIP
jgi:hypothetical protein